ncbi:hypothetical protein HBO12_25780 [Pseudomonas sp. WS 5059]|uniref:hypothetical protein n=1 Tax=Pseudomonas sp. WS 5059 TaxID=2717491 RepID=UPI001473AF14|nr:hypothetical protein [Pseudomonas sp. WS 5059]NMY06371.1 hypothetical protein [Pseudomonas sp. WS 5059]
MHRLIAIALVLIVGQATAEGLPFNVTVFHDAERGATCWLYSGINKGGISCLPDSSLLQQDTAIATPESEAARASLAVSPSENGPVIATPLPQDERFQL